MGTPVNPSRMKGSDPVVVHERWGTVHEVDNGEACCGNNLGGKGNYLSMTRSEARGRPGTRPCESVGCVPARRDRQ
jgi:hypothetical protein